jgi:hypothetical protein
VNLLGDVPGIGLAQSQQVDNSIRDALTLAAPQPFPHNPDISHLQ